MRDRHESLEPVARAETKEALEAFMAKERTDPYTTPNEDCYGGPHSLNKVFNKGGPLEYYNPPDRAQCFQQVSLDDWIAAAVRDWNDRILVIPQV